jgi:hypothetical protein
MGVKRQIEETDNVSEKKTKFDEVFPIEIFVKNLKDPESSFLGKYSFLNCYQERLSLLALREFNEHVRHLSSQEKIGELIESIIQYLQSNLDDVLALITEEKRKSSEVS